MRLTRLAVAAALVAASVVGEPALAAHATTPPAQIIKIGANQHFYVEWRGNGHGHGLSQWGAYGAATATTPLTYRQIVAFYYPGTVIAAAPSSARIRVLIGKAGRTTAVAADPKLAVDGISGVLPTTGVARYRLIAGSPSGLVLQKLPARAGATWLTVTSFPHNNVAAFHRTDYSAVRLFLNDRTSTSYYGFLRAVRTSATTVETVDGVGYDRYVQGVVPREMPATWPAAATDAQAVAARTYADFVARTAPRQPGVYDVYDDTRDQVYGGHIHYNADGSVAYTDFPKAANDTAGQVLRYNSAPVFAQFSASNGGWTVADGVHPYLTAKRDPYDAAAGFPTYVMAPLADTEVTVAALAQQFGLKTITEIDLVRDGHAVLTDPTMWGGRVLSGTVLGTTSSNTAQSVPITGGQLQQAVNNVEANYYVGTTWIQLVPTT
jgi:peptidoglycan hydrolase-like amidase